MRRTTRVIALASITALAVPRGTAAHRLDEYLQATRLAIRVDGISLDVSLTPGADVADRVLAVIDADDDGRISDHEADAYAQRVTGDLRLRVDDRVIPLTLSRREFPDAGDMRAGVGVIRLSATATLVPHASGHHRIAYGNAHMPGISAFLVNTLTPASATVQIGTQQRDQLQRTLVVDYEIAQGGKPVFWSLTAFAAMSALLIGRGRQRRLQNRLNLG